MREAIGGDAADNGEISALSGAGALTQGRKPRGAGSKRCGLRYGGLIAAGEASEWRAAG